MASESSIIQDAAKTITPDLGLPDASWDEGRLLDYMRQHDRAILGLERTSLHHEYCFGAAVQLKYEQLSGRWTQWAKDQGYPLETFRRRRLLFVRAGNPQALDKYDGKMEAYYDLGIYRKPTQKKLDSLDAWWEVKAKSDVIKMANGTPERSSPAPIQGEVAGTPKPDRKVDQAQPEADEAKEMLLDRLVQPDKRLDDPKASELLGKVGSLLLKAEEVGLDASCVALLDEIATTVTRLRDDLGRKGVAA